LIYQKETEKTINKYKSEKFFLSIVAGIGWLIGVGFSIGWLIERYVR
jgi:hypothetical protein